MAKTPTKREKPKATRRKAAAPRLKTGFGGWRDPGYTPPDSQIISRQYFNSRCFEYAGTNRADDGGPEYEVTPAAAGKLAAVVAEYRALMKSLFPGEYATTGDASDGRVDVDMEEWPDGEGFPPSVRRLLKEHGVWAYD